MNSSLRLILSADGSTFYSHQSRCEEGSLYLEEQDAKGICMVSNKCHDPATVLCSEASAVTCIVGERETHICKHCFNKIDRKAKARDDFPTITFCSMKCLEEASAYLDICGVILNNISKINDPNWINITHIMKLAVHYIYEIYIAQTAKELIHKLSVLQLESHENVFIQELQDTSQWLLKQFQTILTKDILISLKSRGLDLTELSANKLIYKLFCIIKYNSQPLTIYGIPKVQLLSLIPNMARINHSCCPNSILLYNTPQNFQDSNINHTDQVIISVVNIRKLEINEEITVSYIQPLCSSLELRQELLKQGFNFSCTCIRCTIEQKQQQQQQQHQQALLQQQQQQDNELYLNHMENFKEAISKIPIHSHPNATTTISSSTGTININDYQSVLEYALLVLQSIESTTIPMKQSLYIVYDGLIHILQPCLILLKTATSASSSNSSIVGKEKWLLFSVQVQLALAQCWKLCNNAYLLSHIEYLIQGGTNLCLLLTTTTIITTKIIELKQKYKKELEEIIKNWEKLLNPSLKYGNNYRITTGSVNTCSIVYISKLYDIAMNILTKLY